MPIYCFIKLQGMGLPLLQGNNTASAEKMPPETFRVSSPILDPFGWTFHFLSRRELSLLFAGLGLLHGACRAKKVEKCHFSSKFVLIEIDAPGVLWAYGRGGPL